MTKINTNYKASTTDAQGPTNDQLRAELEKALAELEQFWLDNSEYLTEAQLVDLNRLKVTLKAECSALEAYSHGVTPGFGPSGTDGNYWEMPDSLVPGWNGVPPECINEFDSDESRIAEDPDKYGEYRGTVEMPNSGDPSDPTKIGFQMTDEMVGLYAESRGRDIIITIEYEDGRRESWVIREGTVRPEPIIISAMGLSHGVTIDCSRVIRVSDGTYAGYPYGTRSGFYIHGTEHDDIIRGSQADDAIVAYAGADKISGEAGVDTIYGDEYYEFAGQFDPNYGGNDEIKGGAGKDIIYGGGGLDTIYKSDRGESVNEYERVKDDVDIDPPDPAGWFSSPDWEAEVDEGMVIISNTSGQAGEINIDMPPGYNMAYAEVDADGSLIITFVGDEGTFKVKIEDFFSEFAGDLPSDRIPTLNFNGSDGADIIDFSRVDVNGQVINIKGGDGEDIILGAHYKMLADGVDLNDMTSSQRNSDGKLHNYVDEGIFGYKDEVKDKYGEDGDDWYGGAGYTARVEDGQIVIESSKPADERADTLNICAPDGYEHGYIASDAAGNLYVILVKPTEDGKAKTIVIKVDASLGLSYKDILVMNKIVSSDGEEVEWSHAFDLIPVGMDADDYTIDGGQGHDIIFTQKGGKVASDSEDDVVEGEYDHMDSAPPTSTEDSSGVDSDSGDADSDDPNGP